MRRIRYRISSSLTAAVFRLALLAAVLLHIDCVAHAQTRGVLEVPERTFDFGQVRQGTIVKHDFSLKNTGNAEIAVQRVVAACGCTATTTSANVIPAGGSVTLSAQFDTNGFSGKREKLIRVYTSDIDKPMETLTLSGEIYADASVEPSNIMFDALEPQASESSRTKEFNVNIRADSGLTFTSSESFSQYLTISEQSRSNAQRSYKVTISSDAPPGDLRSRVVVHLKDAAGKDSTLIVPVFATIKKSIRFVPATLSFGLISPEKIIERVVKLENRSERPLSIKSIKPNNTAVSAEIVELTAGREFSLKIRVDPSKLTKELNASVDLTTDNSEQPTLSLTLLGFKAQAVTEPKG